MVKGKFRPCWIHRCQATSDSLWATQGLKWPREMPDSLFPSISPVRIRTQWYPYALSVGYRGGGEGKGKGGGEPQDLFGRRGGDSQASSSYHSVALEGENKDRYVIVTLAYIASNAVNPRLFFECTYRSTHLCRLHHAWPLKDTLKMVTKRRLDLWKCGHFAAGTSGCYIRLASRLRHESRWLLLSGWLQFNGHCLFMAH